MFDYIDEKRRKSALSGDMTPFEVDSEHKCGKFLGSRGDIYETSLDSCTCFDFDVNGHISPCKHIIRLAMELGELPNDGMITDLKKTYIKYYIGVLKKYVREAPLWDVIYLMSLLNKLSKSTGLACENDALAFAGIPDMLESGLFEPTKNGKKIKATKESKKEIKNMQKALESRVGAFVLERLDYAPLAEALKVLAAEEESF